MRAVTYHPIGDPHHCIYRMMCILGCSPEKKYFVDRLKIMDFFVLFPNMLNNISRPRTLISAMASVDKTLFAAPFQMMPNKKLLFSQLSEIHRVSLLHLLGKGILDLEAYEAGRVLISPNSVGISEKFYEESSIEKSLLNLIVDIIGDMKLFGPDGLKARTGLLEYRYDSA